MNDPLDSLKQALEASTPRPDAERRANTIAKAADAFPDSQGNVQELRPTSESQPKRGLGNMDTPIDSTVNLPPWWHKPQWLASAAVVALAVTLTPVLLKQSPDSQPRREVSNHDLAQIDGAEAPGNGRERERTQTVAKPQPMEEPVVNLTQPSVRIDAAKQSSGIALQEEIAFQPAPQSADLRVTPVIQPEPIVQLEANTEAYANAQSNPLKVTRQSPVSTFSIDVDTASWSTTRNSLLSGYLPAADAVRIEEMLNYFNYELPAPAGNVPFSTNVSLMPTPWNADTQLLGIALQGKMLTGQRPPLNLVFLIDTSGSMQQPNKLPLLVQSLKLLAGRLTADDQVAIVTYAGSAGLVLEPTAADSMAAIKQALLSLEAGGSTAGQAGLQQAYSTAEAMAENAADNAVTRIVLATDGDFNVGIQDPEELTDYIADKRELGVYLSVLGFGRGNLDDATMQALAQNGNGNAAYIDTLAEAQKVLVDEFQGALFPIANDVKIQVEFNPAEVAEYRLIGYETRALAREDFNDDKVDAGEIGVGHQVVALYEITPVGSPATRIDELRYGSAENNAEVAATATDTAKGEIGFLKLRYKEPGASRSQLITEPLLDSAEASSEITFAAAIAGFGQLLRGDDKWLGDWSYADAITLALENRGADEFGYRQEAIRLMRIADSLAEQ